TRVRKPSIAAIQSAIFIRFRWRAVPGLVTRLKLPRGLRHERLSEGREHVRGVPGGLAVAEEAVDGRPGAGHVGAERAEVGEARRERRGGEVVRRQGGEVAGG